MLPTAHTHDLNSRAASVVHTTHKSIIDESTEQMRSHHRLLMISDALKLLMISEEDEHRQNMCVLLRVNAATKERRQPSPM